MYTTISHNRISSWMVRIAAVTLFAAGVSLHAQQPAAPAPAYPALNLQAALNAPLDLTLPSSPGNSFSSSSDDTIGNPAAFFGDAATPAGDSLQPPPRRRYGRPRYNDSSHNADGSNKYTFEGGAGFTLATGGTHNYYKPSYKFQVGGGRNFSNKFAVLAQFDWDNFGVQTNTLNNLLPIYQSLCGSGCTGTPITQIGGNGHIWSFTVNPMYTFMQGDRAGAYVVGGVGYYHKVTNFTTPTVGTYCDYYGFCYQYQANSIIDHYTSNAPGFNGGIGFTYRPSRFSGEKFFAEARYVYTANSSRPYYDGTTGTQLSPTYFNVFPQNSAKTTYIPITFGIRW
jgi:hypothetical protein